MQQVPDLSRERRGGLPAPKPGRNVWPRENCPAFAARRAHLPIEGRQCWYCIYADFRLTCSVALEVGICCYPHIQLI